MTAYSFVSTSAAKPKRSENVHFDLSIRQQPERARVCTSKERERRPIDPPPIIQLQVRTDAGVSQNYLQNPHLFMCANLIHATRDEPVSPPDTGALAGTIVSSLYRLKDIDNSEGGFFVFADVSAKLEGSFRLKFSLFELSPSTSAMSAGPLQANHLISVSSQPFTVYASKTFPGMLQSTFLSRSFSDQGVRIRIRKEHRIQMKPHQSSRDDFRPQMPNTSPVTSLAISTAPSHAREFQGNYSMSAPARPQQQQREVHSPSQVSPTASSYVIRSARHPSQGYHPYSYQPTSPDMQHHAPRYCDGASGIPTSHYQSSVGTSAMTHAPIEGRHHYKHSPDSYPTSAQSPRFFNPYQNASSHATDVYQPSRRSSQNSTASTGHSYSPDRHLRFLPPSSHAHEPFELHHPLANNSNVSLPSIQACPPLDVRKRAGSDDLYHRRPHYVTQDLYQSDISHNGLKLPPLQLPGSSEYTSPLDPISRRLI